MYKSRDALFEFHFSAICNFIFYLYRSASPVIEQQFQTLSRSSIYPDWLNQINIVSYWFIWRISLYDCCRVRIKNSTQIRLFDLPNSVRKANPLASTFIEFKMATTCVRWFTSNWNYRIYKNVLQELTNV